MLMWTEIREAQAQGDAEAEAHMAERMERVRARQSASERP